MVIDDPAEVAGCLQRGLDIVLVVDPGSGHVPRPAAGPGRLAVLVGLVDDPEVRTAAEQMAADLFRSRPVRAGSGPVPGGGPG